MKIKNSVQSISADISVVLMCIGILVACPMRIFQMLRNIDPATGFYIDYDSIMIIILYAVLALASVLILVLSFLSARIPASIAPGGRQIPLAVTSLAVGLTLFFGCDAFIMLRMLLPAEGFIYAAICFMVWVFYIPSQVVLTASYLSDRVNA